MCETCGCGNPDEVNLHGPGHHHDHEHNHEITQEPENEAFTHEHMHEHDGHWHSHSHQHTPKKIINLNVDILSENNRTAEWNRGYFEGKNVKCYNLVSSPGSGKTTILEKTIHDLSPSNRIFVIEGDQQTSRDADRIEKAGAPALQINTGSGCHLDANMIRSALKKMEIANDSILFIENVGNLVCPSLFDLGERKRVLVISITEGDDKPQKYPYMFKSAHLCIINKIDLLPYVDFNIDNLINSAKQLNPELEFIRISAKSGEGISGWYEWLGK